MTHILQKYTCILGLMFMLMTPISRADSELHMQIKAQFIYNFVNYVEWPNDAFKTPTSSMKICLYGDIPFSAYLLSFAGSIIGQRELTFVVSTSVEDIESGCHVLFVGNDRKVDLETFWQKIQYIYVLSIGEQKGFSEQGGIINIVRPKDKLEFEVNIENALNNGLFLDSDLLSLARTIKRNTQIKP